MRLSMDDPNPLNMTAKIYLNGVEMAHCVMADEELGEVEVIAVDENGRPVVEGDEVKTIKLRGEVRIRIPDPLAAHGVES